MARFTTKQLDALRPTDKQFELSEPGGLRVRVYPSGRIVFVLRYRDPAGKQRVVTLGTYPSMGLAQARVELAKAQAARGTGTDPAEARTQSSARSRDGARRDAFKRRPLPTSRSGTSKTSQPGSSAKSAAPHPSMKRAA